MKAIGGVLVAVGVVLGVTGLIWGRAGYYASQAPILLGLVVAGGALAVVGGLVARGSGAPELPAGARMVSTADMPASPGPVAAPLPDALALEAVAPATSPERLAEIAYSRPDLRAAVAEHPAAYDDLRAWIERYGDSA